MFMTKQGDNYWWEGGGGKILGQYFIMQVNHAYINVLIKQSSGGELRTTEFVIKYNLKKLVDDERLLNQEVYFKTVVVLYGTVDIDINQLTNRSEGKVNISDAFQVLRPEFLSSASDESYFLKTTHQL